jgi:hypothetical protein
VFLALHFKRLFDNAGFPTTKPRSDYSQDWQCGWKEGWLDQVGNHFAPFPQGLSLLQGVQCGRFRLCDAETEQRIL